MSRTPRSSFFAALPLTIALVVAAILWTTPEQKGDSTFAADIMHPPARIGESAPESDVVGPTLEGEKLCDVTTDPMVESREPAGEANSADSPTDLLQDIPFQDTPFQSFPANFTWGSTRNSNSMFRNRFDRSSGSEGQGASGIAIARGLQWLADHQDEDGKWDADGFDKHDPPGDRATGYASADHDIAVTGLALLAFLGDGHSITRGSHKAVVIKGLKWLIAQRDPESGFFGGPLGQRFMYDHAIATLAMCEAYYIDKSVIVRRHAQNAINFITEARNHSRGWFFEDSTSDSNDTSVIGWMISALKLADVAGLKVDKKAYAAAIERLDELTDPVTGRVGYAERGKPLTAATLFCRFLLGQNPEDDDNYMDDHADLLLGTLPDRNRDGLRGDMDHWYHGSYAMFQMGNEKDGARADYWNEWRAAMEPAVLGSQRKDGASEGSWDPLGPGGESSGRVDSTAMMVLCLEVDSRYARILDVR